MRRPNYEPAAEYRQHAYSVAGWGKGIVFTVCGWETEPDEDTEWSGYENRTGRLVVCMIGDDRLHVVDPEDVTPIGEAFCVTYEIVRKLINGAWQVSAIVNGYLVTRTYYGYTKCEALRIFRHDTKRTK